ncbi:MAG: hypothetical protein ABIF19_15005 [Planctomycetota bacterium]
MFDIFEQPWTLLGAAVLVLFGILTFRSFCPEKRRWWQLLVPALLAVCAFGLDLLVQTDLEGVNAVINKAMKAVEEEDHEAIAQVLSDSYSDSYHSSRQSLLARFRSELSRSSVSKNTKTGLLIDLSAPSATAVLFATLVFDKNSFIAQNYKSFLFVKARLYLRKQPGRKWLIERIEVLELDRQPVSWNSMR